MTWTHTYPTSGRWYWSRETGLNLDEPLLAWVFDTSGSLYACRYGPHDLLCFREPHRLDGCLGQWCGPWEVPE